MFCDHKEFSNHEMVIVCRDEAAGLSALIAIHSTTAGPAMGGCRISAYQTEDEAITDVLRLSRGMTYKNVMAGLPFGGGKAVIVADPHTEKTPQLLRAFATRVDRLGGTFITGEDIGTTVTDIETMRAVTPHVRGIPENGPGDPSPMTALGVFAGIQAAVGHQLKIPNLKGVRVIVQGLGAVGMRLAKMLNDARARLIVSDIDHERVIRVCDRFGATAASPESCHAEEADVFAPCARGALLRKETIEDLRVSVVAGAANNQLATSRDGQRLMDRGILYAPDYVINAGGVISTALEGPSFDGTILLERVHRIADLLREIFHRADAEAIPTSVMADRMAEERLAKLRTQQ
jgi:leucine dehydrogenase